jgi:cob(I)alamin adenosyltransferase
MSVIYTRRGDAGKTRNGLDKKMSKASIYPKVLGHIDELNVMIGWVKTALLSDRLKEKLHKIQSNLFNIAATLAYQKGEKEFAKNAEDYLIEISNMEEDIDIINKKYGPLNRFLYPGKNELSVRWHMARVACRHMERNLVALSKRHQVPTVILAYINRLSDWLFMQAYKAEEAT